MGDEQSERKPPHLNGHATDMELMKKEKKDRRAAKDRVNGPGEPVIEFS